MYFLTRKHTHRYMLTHTYIYIHSHIHTCSLVHLFLHTFMCSPVDGPMRSEASHFFIKSFELRCHEHIFLLFVLLYYNTRDACLFVAMHFMHIYIYIYTYICTDTHIYIYICMCVSVHTHIYISYIYNIYPYM